MKLTNEIYILTLMLAALKEINRSNEDTISELKSTNNVLKIFGSSSKDANKTFIYRAYPTLLPFNDDTIDLLRTHSKELCSAFEQERITYAWNEAKFDDEMTANQRYKSIR